MPDLNEPQKDPASNSPSNGISSDLVRVKLSENDLTYDTIKNAIYAQARYLFEKDKPIRELLLSKDIYEILNRRLVFKTAAHKEQPHFITPYGNLRVVEMDASLDEPLSFIIDV
jgi:hypothetical protein